MLTFEFANNLLPESLLLLGAASESHDAPEPRRRQVRYRMGEGIVGRVVQGGKPVIVPRISQEPLFLDRLHRRRDNPGQEFSFICVPIAIGSEIGARRRTPASRAVARRLVVGSRGFFSVSGAMLIR